MRPAFASTGSAIAFLLLLAFVIVLPALMARSDCFDRRDVYLSSPPHKNGDIPWIYSNIFERKGNLDLVFVGSSRMWWGFDTPYVKNLLSERLGRKADVITLGWTYYGFDATYICAKDLLDHRQVHTLVVYDDGGGDAPHIFSSHWFRVGENADALVGLDFKGKMSLYAGAVLGMPRHILSMLRPNPPSRPDPSIVEEDGTAIRRFGFRTESGNFSSFLPYEPPGGVPRGNAVSYSIETKSAFDFTGPKPPTYQIHFAKKLASLCKEHGTQLVFIHFPPISESKQTTIPERLPWPDVLDSPTYMIGVPAASLFASMPASDIIKLYQDEDHFNLNGRTMFTRCIAPALIDIYELHDRDHQ